MLVQILDRIALSSLSVISLRSYLDSHGWIDEGTWGDRPITVFSKEHSDRKWEILVPHRDTIGGYMENVAETVAVLASIEDRSQLEVFNDVSATGADVIRLRSSNGVSRETLSLRQSATLLNDAYVMVASAARAVEKPQATYRGPVSSDVAEYLDNVQPFSGYYQGYDITLHSPVPAGFESQTDLGDDFLAPFSRRATLKLAEALEHSNEAISGIFSDDPVKRFRQVVKHGVSANLCDAVAGLAKRGEGIEIDLFWAPVRPSTVRDYHYQFSENSADILTEAARTFRRDEPSFGEPIVAQVVRLEREPEEFDGKATLLYIRDGHPTRLRVEFEKSVYNNVIRAFQGRDPIRLDGDIYRIGNVYELRNPRNLTVLPERNFPDA